MLELTIADPAGPQVLACGALLFDMDGTLVDSGECVEQTWRGWAGRHGLDIDKLLRISHGRQNSDVIQIMAPHLDTPEEYAYLTRSEEDCRDGIVPVRGACELLGTLDGAAWAVVTSAWRRLAEIRLGCAGLPMPRVLVTADDIREGKPHPEGYLRAAARLGVTPAACVVVEDAPAGIAAARAAGMRIIGVATTFPRDRLDCDWCVDDLTSLRIRAISEG